MATFSDASQPYGNKFDVTKRFSKVLFRPGRPVFSSELLESESIQQNQLEMLGDSLFQEGAVISGMEIIPKPDNKDGNHDQPANTFSVSSLFAHNSRLDTADYVSDGIIKVISEANMPDDVVSFDFTGNASRGLDQTVSFSVTKTSGTLNRINLQYDDSKLQTTGWTVDGKTIQTSINDVANGTPLVDNGGNQITLDDGKEHKFVATFRTNASGTDDFTIVVNAGYDSTSLTSEVAVKGLYVEDGSKADNWIINDKDTGTASNTQRVKNYTVSSGRVYLNGAVREFDSQDFSIKGIGEETIGLRLDETVVTSADDPSLRDSTPGAVTLGEAGADRLHYNVVLTYNDASATPFAVFQDNVLNQRAVKPDYSNLEPILAKRTYDQSGSYRSYGFEGHLRMNPDPTKGAQDPSDASKLLLDIDAGQAYVRGYSISTSEPTTLHLDIANEKSQASNEGYYYNGSNDSITLINQPVFKVSQVTYTSRKDLAYAHPISSNLIDKFTDDNVVYIRKVYQGSTEYIEGTDFTYVSNSIHWGQDLSGGTLPNAKTPVAGQTYHIIYDYAINATEGKDYSVNRDKDTNVTTVNFNVDGGTKPVAGTTVNITYTYFNARIDMIRITTDQSNPFKVVKGQPAPISKVTPPVVKDPYSLELGYVLIQPNSHMATFTLQTVTRITFDTLQQWGIRLTNTEYNVAIDRMTQSVKQSEDPVILKDAFADGFASNTNADENATTTAYDPDNGEILMPAQADAKLVPDINKNTSQIAIKGHLVTPPYHEESAIDQPIATGIVNVNPYNIFHANGNLVISPASDSWVENHSVTNFATVDGGTLNLHKWWRHTNDQSQWDGGKTAAQWAADYKRNEIQWDSLAGIHDPGAGNTLHETGWMIADGGSQTSYQSIQYMRTNHITFHATNLSPFEEGYKITIDGTPVQDPQPESKDFKGAVENTFRTNAKGEIKGTFEIPGGTIRTGTRTVKVYSDNGDTASTTYVAYGSIATTTNTIEKRVYDVNLWDPLAQSFYLQEQRQLSSVDLYFFKKPGEAAPGQKHKPQLIVQLREMGDTEYPTRVVRSEVYLDPDDIKTSDDGSVGTRVVFPDSVTLNANQGYAIVLISDSDEYSLFRAVKGKTVVAAGESETVYNTRPGLVFNKDPQATGNNVTITNKVSAKVGDVLTKTPNSNGDLFISNNGMTWTADGASSLKFRVNVASYLPQGEIVFDPIILSSWNNDKNTIWNEDLGPALDGKSQTPNTQLSAIDRLATLTDFLTYQQTSLHWYIKVLQPGDLTGSNLNGLADYETLLASKPWQSLEVINHNQYRDPIGTNADQVPRITSDRSPQQVEGELKFFQNTIAVQLKADFDSEKYIAPIVNEENLTLRGVLTGRHAEYESLNLGEEGDAAFNKIKLQYDAYIPDLGTELPHVNPMYSIDGGNTWYNFPADGGNSKTVDKDSSDTSTPTSTEQVTSYFKRYIYEATVPTAEDQNHLAKQCKFRLKMTSANNFITPRVRRLSAVMKRDLKNS